MQLRKINVLFMNSLQSWAQCPVNEVSRSSGMRGAHKGEGTCTIYYEPSLQKNWLHLSLMRTGMREAGSTTRGLFWSDHIWICVQAGKSNILVSRPPREELLSNTKARAARVKSLDTSKHRACIFTTLVLYTGTHICVYTSVCPAM